MKYFTYPTLEVGEKLVEIAGLVLVYDRRGNLIYMRCQDGKSFTVSAGAYLLLEMIGRRPQHVFSYDT